MVGNRLDRFVASSWGSGTSRSDCPLANSTKHISTSRLPPRLWNWKRSPSGLKLLRRLPQSVAVISFRTANAVAAMSLFTVGPNLCSASLLCIYPRVHFWSELKARHVSRKQRRKTGSESARHVALDNHLGIGLVTKQQFP